MDESLTISPLQLQERLAQHDVIVVVDCRFSLQDTMLGAKQFAQGHIPGAFHLDMEQDLSLPPKQRTAHGGRHPLPDAEVFAETLRSLGVSGDTLVVAYDDNRLAGAARLWWLLRYFGHSRVAVLDGGFAAWQKAGLPVEEGEKAVGAGAGNFIPRPQRGQVVDYQQLNDADRPIHWLLIDSREPARFQGVEEPIDPIAGAIPGAVNFPWQDVTDTSGQVLSKEQHRQRWQALDATVQPVVYCGSGVTACVNLFSMALAGVENPLLYAGSWSDWCSWQ